MSGRPWSVLLSPLLSLGWGLRAPAFFSEPIRCEALSPDARSGVDPILGVFMRTIDIELLKSNLLYKQETGEFFSRTSRGNIAAGKKLGTKADGGYMTLNVGGTTLYFHRAVYAYHHGLWPAMVDHINGDRSDNRIENLRASDKKTNARNAAAKKGARFRGANKRASCWEVSIRTDEKQLYIGRYKSEFEAAYNYDLASLAHHGKFGRRNFLPLVV